MTTNTNGTQLMYITQPNPTLPEVEQVRKVLEGGCRFIQLRLKQGWYQEIANAVVALCHTYKALICINDHPGLAVLSRAHGVHLGAQDIAVHVARMAADTAGLENFLIGATANTFDDIRRAVDDGASYIGLGPYRYTETKSNLSPLLGLEGIRNIMQQCDDAGIEIPIFAIGGIEPEDITPLMEAGVDGIAVSGAILRAADPTAETRHFLQLINA